MYIWSMRVCVFARVWLHVKCTTTINKSVKITPACSAVSTIAHYPALTLPSSQNPKSWSNNNSNTNNNNKVRLLIHLMDEQHVRWLWPHANYQRRILQLQWEVSVAIAVAVSIAVSTALPAVIYAVHVCVCVSVSMHTLQQTTIGIVLCQKQSRCRQSMKREKEQERRAGKGNREEQGLTRGLGLAGNRRQLNYLRVKHVRLTQQMRTWHRGQRQQNYAK